MWAKDAWHHGCLQSINSYGNTAVSFLGTVFYRVNLKLNIKNTSMIENNFHFELGCYHWILHTKMSRYSVHQLVHSQHKVNLVTLGWHGHCRAICTKGSINMKHHEVTTDIHVLGYHYRYCNRSQDNLLILTVDLCQNRPITSCNHVGKTPWALFTLLCSLTFQFDCGRRL